MFYGISKKNKELKAFEQVEGTQNVADLDVTLK